MSLTKQVRRVVLFLILAALVTGTPAQAGKHYNVNLAPTGIEPTASGQVRVDVPRYPWLWWRLSVNCQGLQPGETYGFLASGFGPGGGASWDWCYFTADATGSGTAGVEIISESLPIRMGVTNANGDDVLTGEF